MDDGSKKRPKPVRSRESSEKGGAMKIKDLFVPKYLHSDPEVRLRFIGNTEDTVLLKSISEQDADASVRKAATERAKWLKEERHQTA